ncbi:hypothetical protein Tco_1403850 [Tanacetum coccineum]
MNRGGKAEAQIAGSHERAEGRGYGAVLGLQSLHAKGTFKSNWLQAVINRAPEWGIIITTRITAMHLIWKRHGPHADAISSKPNIGQQGIRHNIKQEPLEIGRDSDRLHPSFPPQLTRSTFVQAPWNNKSPSPVNITVQEEPRNFQRDQWRSNLSRGFFP